MRRCWSGGIPSLSIHHENVSKSGKRREKCPWRALRTLNLRFDIVDGVGRLHLEGDSLPREGFHKNLHSDLNKPMCGLSLQPSWQLCCWKEKKVGGEFDDGRNIEMSTWAAKPRIWIIYFPVGWVALTWRALRHIEPVRSDHDCHWLFPICVAVANRLINNERLFPVEIRSRRLHDFSLPEIPIHQETLPHTYTHLHIHCHKRKIKPPRETTSAPRVGLCTSIHRP
jgi:hypothetical protein